MEATTQGKAELISALAKATLEFEAITKDGKADVTTKSGGKYSYGYATLDQIINATKTALSNNGLVISHTTKEIDGKMWLVSKLRHESGCKSDKVKSQIDKYVSDGYMSAVQSYGSIITYLKRYHVGMLLNIAIDEDTDASDGKSGGKTTTQGKATTTKEKPKDETQSVYKTLGEYTERINRMETIFELNKWVDKHTPDLKKLTKADQDKIRDLLADRRKDLQAVQDKIDALKLDEGEIPQDDPDLGLGDGEKEHNPPD